MLWSRREWWAAQYAPQRMAGCLPHAQRIAVPGIMEVAYAVLREFGPPVCEHEQFTDSAEHQRGSAVQACLQTAYRPLKDIFELVVPEHQEPRVNNDCLPTERMLLSQKNRSWCRRLFIVAHAFVPVQGIVVRNTRRAGDLIVSIVPWVFSHDVSPCALAPCFQPLFDIRIFCADPSADTSGGWHDGSGWALVLRSSNAIDDIGPRRP